MIPSISIFLDIPSVHVLNTEQNESGDYIITVESSDNFTICRKCGKKIVDFHGHDDWITLRHLPILNHSVYIRLRPKRFRCPYCSERPTTTQQLSWYKPKSPHTRAYDEYILLRLIHSTI